MAYAEFQLVVPSGDVTALCVCVRVSCPQVGDEVALEPGVPCGDCTQCSHGRYNLCPDVEFFATPPVHGSFARYINHPAKYCFKLPPGVSLEEGAMVEPMSVGVHACRRAGVSAGHTVCILGAGPIGTCWSRGAHLATAVGAPPPSTLAVC